MSVESEIAILTSNMQNAYTAVSNKGGTLPSAQNMDNLATAISSISSGSSTPVIESLNVTPTISAQTIIAPSGTDGYNPVNIAAITNSIDSNITAENIKKDITILGVTGNYEGSGGGSFIGIPREVKNGVYQTPTENFTFSLPNDASNVGTYGLSYAFRSCSGLTSVNLSALTTVATYGLNSAFNGCTRLTGLLDLSSLTSVGSYGLYWTFYDCKKLTSVNLSALTSVDSYGLHSVFYNCTGLTSVDLSALTSVAERVLYNAFYGCSALTSINLSSLTTVSGNYGLTQAFRGCTRLTNVDLSALTTVSSQYGLQNAFDGCTALTSVDLSSLTTVSGAFCFSKAFCGCTALTDIYFNSLTTTSFGSRTNQFSTMMSNTGTSKTHTLHFPNNLQSTISGLTGYPLFGGTSGYIVCAFDLPATS